MIGATHLIKRVWQIYVAHIIVFVMYVAEIGYLSQRYNDPNLQNEFNVAGFMHNPSETLNRGLILAFKPVNMDVLPLYILLMLFFPPVLWAMRRRPNLTLGGSFLLCLAARHFNWNLHAYPTAWWYFNPFCWQLLFVFGAWFALGRLNRVEAADPVALAAGARRRLPRFRTRDDHGRELLRTRCLDARVAR